MRILLIEDDPQTAQTVKEELEKQFIVEVANSGVDGEYQAHVNKYDLIILDYMLPDINGIDVCKSIRSSGNHAAILMLTGEAEVSNKVQALESGADDYLTKPFSFDELRARIKALLRRQSGTFSSNILQLADLSFDIDKKIVKRNGIPIELRRKELYLLEYLMRNCGRVVTREMILDHAWDSASEPMTNTVDVHINYLREKIDKPFAKKLIKTAHGLGYKMEA